MHVFAMAPYRMRAVAICFVMLAAATGSQTSAQSDVGDGRLAAFEYASVLPSHPASGPIVSVSPDSGEFTARGVSLKELIGYAYNVAPSKVLGGPRWVESAHWEVTGVLRRDLDAEGSPVTTDEVRPLVRGLLIDYFGLEVHVETTQLETVIIDTVGDQPRYEPDGHLFETLPSR
jgi:hypothetical protein